ncbi:hypothetical protein BH11GEM2_BH11GEM2_30780 [soil metagenome]
MQPLPHRFDECVARATSREFVQGLFAFAGNEVNRAEVQSRYFLTRNRPDTNSAEPTFESDPLQRDIDLKRPTLTPGYEDAPIREAREATPTRSRAHSSVRCLICTLKRSAAFLSSGHGRADHMMGLLVATPQRARR